MLGKLLYIPFILSALFACVVAVRVGVSFLYILVMRRKR